MKLLPVGALLILLIATNCHGSVVDERLRKLSLNQRSLDHLKNLHYNWYLFSIKALFVQLAKRLLLKMDTKTKTQFLRCLSRIREVKEIEKSARCLVDARDKWNARRKDPEILENVRRKRSPHRLTIPSHLLIKNASKPPSLLSSSSSPVQRVTKLFSTLFTNTSYESQPQNWERTYAKMKEMQTKLEKQEEGPQAKVYKYRMYDIVLDRTTTKKTENAPFDNIFALANSFGGTETNVRVLSPRFLPVVPNSSSRRGFLSPALFPLYNDEKEPQVLPIPKMLDKWGMSENDRNAVLRMIMEVTGARETVEDAMKMLENLNSYGVGDAIFKATGELSKTFEKLRKSFNNAQKNSLEKRGFTIMDSKQMKRFHDEVGISGKQKELDYDEYGKLTRGQRHDSLWNTVEQFAAKPPRRRVKRQFKLISVLSPVILAPYMFAPVYGISILGPVILSPNIFSPLILNPSVLGPWILSPSVPLPFILSPYLLSPYILSPLVMAPFILNPYVLSPNVINPYVLSPVILSPVVLCPDVLSPMVLSGPILSPGVLSPVVLTKSVLMANVLSPTVLS